jgi:hypothetical protein
MLLLACCRAAGFSNSPNSSHSSSSSSCCCCCPASPSVMLKDGLRPLGPFGFLGLGVVPLCEWGGGEGGEEGNTGRTHTHRPIVVNGGSRVPISC